MRKFCTVLCACLLLSVLSGCGEKDDTSGAGGTDGRKLGLGTVAGVAMDGVDANRVKVTVAAVVLTANGTIEECELDELEFTIRLENGRVTGTPPMMTKGEMGDGYIPTEKDTGNADGAAKSWEEQADAFADFAEGKKPGEITGLATTDGKTDKVPGCNLIVTDIIQAIDRAATNARAGAIGRDDDLHVAVVAATAKAATAEDPQYNVELAAVTLNEGDKITASMTDSLSCKLTITDGVFTTVSGPVESKRQKGDAYGMKQASAIKREWYQQADAFDDYARGKTASEVRGITTDAAGKVDAISGCTMDVNGFIKSISKAAAD